MFRQFKERLESQMNDGEVMSSIRRYAEAGQGLMRGSNSSSSLASNGSATTPTKIHNTEKPPEDIPSLKSQLKELKKIHEDEKAEILGQLNDLKNQIRRGTIKIPNAENKPSAPDVDSREVDLSVNLSSDDGQLIDLSESELTFGDGDTSLSDERLKELSKLKSDKIQLENELASVRGQLVNSNQQTTAQMDELVREKLRLQTELDSFKQRLESFENLKSKLSASISEKTTLETELKSFKIVNNQRLQDLNNELKSLKSERDYLTSELTESRKRFEACSTSLEESNKVTEQLNHDQELMKEKMQLLETQISEHKDERSAFETKISSLQNDNSCENKSAIEDLQRHNENHLKRIQELLAEKAANDAKNENLVSQLDALQRNLSDLQQLQARISPPEGSVQSEADIESILRENTSLKEEMSALKETYSRCDSELNKVKEQMISLQTSLTDASSSLSSSNQELSQRDDVISRQKATIEEAENRAAQHAEERDKLRKKLESLQKQMISQDKLSSKQLMSVEDERDQLKQELEAQKNNSSAQSAKQHDLENLLELTQRELGQVKQDYDQLQLDFQDKSSDLEQLHLRLKEAQAEYEHSYQGIFHENEALQVKINTLENKLENSSKLTDDDISNLEREKNKLRSEIESIQKEMSSSAQKIVELEEDNLRLVSQRNSLQKELDSVLSKQESELEALRQENSKMLSALTEATTQFEKAEMQKNEQSKQIRHLESQIGSNTQSSQVEKEELVRKNEILVREINDVRAELEQYNARLSEMASDRDQMLNEVSNVNAKAETDNLLLESARAEASSLQQGNDSLADEVKALQDKISSLERRISAEEESRSEITRISERAAKLEEQLEESNRTIKQQAQRMTEMKKQYQKLQTANPTSQNNGNNNVQMKSDPTSPSPDAKAVNRRPRLSSSNQLSTSEQGEMAIVIETEKEINLTYLRNILFKFITAGDSEAQHIVKAISTMVSFTPEQERVARETIEKRRHAVGLLGNIPLPNIPGLAPAGTSTYHSVK